MAISSKADPHARLPRRQEPLPDDHPDLLAISQSGLPEKTRNELLALMKSYDLSSTSVPPKYQGYAIDIQARATVPLLASFAAAGAIPWTLFANVKLQPKSPWMRLTSTQFEEC